MLRGWLYARQNGRYGCLIKMVDGKEAKTDRLIELLREQMYELSGWTSVVRMWVPGPGQEFRLLKKVSLLLSI